MRDALERDASTRLQRERLHALRHRYASLTPRERDVKRVRGGLVEIEFIAQTLQLLNGERDPGILDVNTARALEKLAAARGIGPVATTRRGR